MQPITIQYADGTQHTYQVPTRYQELSPAQFVGAVAAMQEAEQKPEAQWQLIPLLMQIPVRQLDDLSEIQRVELLSQLSFIFDPEQLPFQWLIPQFLVADYRKGCLRWHPNHILRDFSTRLYGPGDGLKHLTFGEFMHLEQRYEKYQSAADVPAKARALDEFCGILYRRQGPGRRHHDDPRLLYDGSLIPYYARYFALLRDPLKQALLLNYQGARAQFRRLYKHVFPAALQSEKGQKKKLSQSLTWLNTAVAMAERNVARVQEIERSPLHLVLKVLDDTLAHNEEMRNEYERHRNR